ncbi:MAG: hypothetical protein J6M95_04800 [Bacilli bacterium]|nr:hypothetical protein [Bacilli bacterium]
MKKYLTLKNLLICCGAFLALLVFIFSFLASLRVTNGSNWAEYKGIIWGVARINYSDGSADILAQADRIGASVLALIGSILVILGGICAVVLALVGNKFLNDKLLKIFLIVCGGLIVLGGIFTFFAEGGHYAAGAQKAGVSVDDYKSLLTIGGSTVSCALPIVTPHFL